MLQLRVLCKRIEKGPTFLHVGPGSRSECIPTVPSVYEVYVKREWMQSPCNEKSRAREGAKERERE